MGTNHNISSVSESTTLLEPVSTPYQHDYEFNTGKGVKSVLRVYSLLRGHGHKVKIMPTSGEISPYDLLVDGKHRVEVKVSGRQKGGDWVFNIHRHGLVDETSVDAYVLRLEHVPEFKYAIHLVIPAPLGMPTLNISLRSLITRYGRYYNRFDFIGGMDKGMAKQIASEFWEQGA